jgi:hypothetical protein
VVQVVLLQELDRWNAGLVVMIASLRDLQRALVGEIGFSTALEKLASSLYNGKLPDMWAKNNPATEKQLGAWITWLLRRYTQYRDWVEKGEPKVSIVNGEILYLSCAGKKITDQMSLEITSKVLIPAEAYDSVCLIIITHF